VTGAPRLDRWRRVTNAPTNRVVLLSFLNPGKYYASSKMFFSIAEAVRRAVAKSGLHWELVIKCKNVADHQPIRQQFAGFAHIRVGHDMPLPDLLSSASVIVGANSLSMVESLLSAAHLIVPTFATNADDPEAMLFDPSDELVTHCIGFASSIADLEQRILIASQSPPSVDRAARLSLLQRYICHDEAEPSTSRVIAFIRNFAVPQASSTAPVRLADAASERPKKNPERSDYDPRLHRL
jgi:hypothetical protein